MGHVNNAKANENKLSNFGFLADRFPQMAKTARAIVAKGDKAKPAELAQLRSLQGWNTRYARMAGVIPSRTAVAAKVEKPCRTLARAARVLDEPTVEIGKKLRVVNLFLTQADSDSAEVMMESNAPNAPVNGQSWYVVLNHSKDGKTVSLFHPWTLTRFDIPALAFKPTQEGAISPFQIAKSLEQTIRLWVSLNRPVYKYVHAIKAQLQQKAVR